MSTLDTFPHVAAVERMVMMKQLTPEQRYLKQLTQNATILIRVQDKHLASLLGMTPVSLSRLKSRLLKRN